MNRSFFTLLAATLAAAQVSAAIPSEKSPQCYYASNWTLIDNPSFVLDDASGTLAAVQGDGLSTPAGRGVERSGWLLFDLSNGPSLALAEAQMGELLRAPISPFFTYPLALNISKGPESGQGQGGKIFVSGAAIYRTSNPIFGSCVRNGVVLTAPMRYSKNFGKDWSDSSYDCSTNPGGPNNCVSGTYCSETGSLGIRVVDSARNLAVSFHEDNVFRETNNSGQTFEKIADLNTQLGAIIRSLFGGRTLLRLLITDAYSTPKTRGHSLIATANLQLSDGTYKGAILSSSDSGETWTILSTLGAGSPGNHWLTSITVDTGSPNQNPMIYVGGYTNFGSGDSTWYVARKNLLSGSFQVIENLLTRGRFSSANRLLVQAERLIVTGVLMPNSSQPQRVGLIRTYNTRTLALMAFQTLLNGDAYDTAAGKDQEILASGTENGRPRALVSRDQGLTWSLLGVMPSFWGSGWGYGIGTDHKGDAYWIAQDQGGWKTFKLECR